MYLNRKTAFSDNIYIYMRPVYIVKLGGSLITHKDRAFSARIDVVQNIATVIKEVYDPRERQLYLGNGAGSYAHVPATEYQTKRGFRDENSLIGASKVKEAALKLHGLCLEVLVETGVPAFSFSAGSFVLGLGEGNEGFLTPLIHSAEIGLVPLFYGDVIIDKQIGFTIYSTEKIIGILVRELFRRDRTAKITVLHLGTTDGVLDGEGRTIEGITEEIYPAVKHSLGASHGYDVTGGMLHKVEESLILARLGARVVIANGERFHRGYLLEPEKQKRLTLIE